MHTVIVDSLSEHDRDELIESMESTGRRCVIVPPESDECYTPPDLFEKIGLEFDLDVCSPVFAKTYVPARRRFTVIEDGLSKKWDWVVWMNPPFSNSTPWVEKFIAHHNGVCLVPFSRAKWFLKLWECDCMLAMPPVQFTFIKNEKRHNIYMPVVLAAFGETCSKAIQNCGIPRTKNEINNE